MLIKAGHFGLGIHSKNLALARTWLAKDVQ